MYYKGAAMLQTLRTLLGNDRLFLTHLKAMVTDMAAQPTNTEAVVSFWQRILPFPAKPFFDAYLRHTADPVIYWARPYVEGFRPMTLRWAPPNTALRLTVPILVGAQRFEQLITGSPRLMAEYNDEPPYIDPLQTLIRLAPDPQSPK